MFMQLSGSANARSCRAAVDSLVSSGQVLWVAAA
jgi:hypothetical protein